MADNSLTYCDSDEEVFFGKVTEKDVRKRVLLGQYFDSPVVNCSTPRPRASGKLGTSSSLGLPDVLNDSVLKKNMTSNCEGLSENTDESKSSSLTDDNAPILNASPNNENYDSSDDVVVIDLDSQNDSVMIISDDESFIQHEESAKNLHKSRSSDGTGHDNEVSDAFNVILTGEMIRKTSHTEIEKCLSANKDADETTDDVLKNLNEYLGNSSNISNQNCGSQKTAENSNVENISFSFNQELEFGADDVNKNENFISQIEQDFEHHFTIESRNGEHSISTEEGIKSKEKSFLRETAESIKDNGTSSMASQLELVAETKKRETIDPLSVEALIQASIHLESQVENKEKPIAEVSGLSDLDCSSLNGISDSVLNISHGSSLLSSPGIDPRKSNLGLLANVIYEDISCDGDQLLDDKPKYVENSEDLMSVDETDFKQGQSDLIESRSSMNTSCYKSCLNGSDNSYFTALDTISRNPSASQQSSSSFQSYRDNTDNSRLTGEKNDLETSFEMVMKTRQSSFTDTIKSATVPESAPGHNSSLSTTGSTPGQLKTKSTSKLPVFQSSTGLLKPPKLNVKPEVLITSNYGWAKKLQQDANKTMSAKEKQVNLKTKIPSTSSVSRPTHLPKPTPIKSSTTKKTATAKLATPCADKLKIPTENKTPARGLMSQSSRIVKSDTKSPRSLKPVYRNLASSESKEDQRKSPAVLRERERYKNIISPIRAYITGCPVVLMKKETVLDGVVHMIDDSKRTPVSHLPIWLPTPAKETTASKQLVFESGAGQENVNPNYTRDTIPCRIMENATAVFIKEPEVPKRQLPKLGGTMQKLLDTPRPKVVVHHGRTKESPKVKGVLIPNNINFGESGSLQASGRISIRQVKSPEKTNTM